MRLTRPYTRVGADNLTFDTMLVDVDYYWSQAMFPLYDIQEGFSTLQLVDFFKLRAKAQALMHFLHALLSVAFQTTFVLVLNQLILLSAHLKSKETTQQMLCAVLLGLTVS